MAEYFILFFEQIIPSKSDEDAGIFLRKQMQSHAVGDVMGGEGEEAVAEGLTHGEGFAFALPGIGGQGVGAGGDGEVELLDDA